MAKGNEAREYVRAKQGEFQNFPNNFKFVAIPVIGL